MVDSYSGIISALSYNHYINKTVQFFLVVNMSAECIACQNPVRAREQGLQCEGCRFRWQHCTCGTGISQCDYSFAVQTGASIDWRCVTCLFMSLSESTPVAESTPVDFTESMSILHEPLADPAADESSNLEPLPAPVTLSPSKSGKAALRRRKGKPKLIDSRYYCYNIKRRGGNPTDWQCTVKRKVTVLKLSYALPVFTREV